MSWTDTVQATLMIFALILTPLIVILGTGGPGDSLQAIAALDPARRLVQGRRAGLVGIVSLLAWGLGTLRAAAHPGALHGRRFAGGDPTGAAGSA